MKKWNYRVIYNPEDRSYGIHEVYYDSDGKPHLWSENCVSLQGESFQDLQRDFHLIQGAFSKPCLEISSVDNQDYLQEM